MRHGRGEPPPPHAQNSGSFPKRVFWMYRADFNSRPYASISKPMWVRLQCGNHHPARYSGSKGPLGATHTLNKNEGPTDPHLLGNNPLFLLELLILFK